MSLFGLIGKKLGHSYSKQYFEAKFEELHLEDHSYNLYELDDISEIKNIFSLQPKGLNVTVPYKEQIIKYLQGLDTSAQKVGAVNVIAKRGSQYIGFNSDYYGFQVSVKKWLPTLRIKALVLGTGGASKAVTAALGNLNIEYQLVSRNKGSHQITYDELNADLLSKHQLIINTTPLGMYPAVDTHPNIPYKALSKGHYLYDLVYNPEKTAFLLHGEAHNANIKNGLEMLKLQAERSWDIWNNNL